MTPAARLQAAIEILDNILDGEPAEKALTAWGRRSRYAGSKDRAAVRDHVFNSLRCLRSHAVLGGSKTGRGLVLGSLLAAGEDPEQYFTGEGHAPAKLNPGELPEAIAWKSDAERLDVPDWLWPSFLHSLGDSTEAAAKAMQQRAPVFLRANLVKTTREKAADQLVAEGILTRQHAASPTALEVIEGARRLRTSESFQSGLVELQDAASQAVVDCLPLQDGMRVLDYCAGGGGKSLAMAALARLSLFAHDAEPRRMKDIPSRATRAGVKITCLETPDLKGQQPFDLVLCDAPCSGSGSWRRDPEGKWKLTGDGLERTKGIQAAILDRASRLVSPNGYLAYATCSMLREENDNQIKAFLERSPEWEGGVQAQWQVQDGTDGFFVCVLTRRNQGC